MELTNEAVVFDACRFSKPSALAQKSVNKRTEAIAILLVIIENIAFQCQARPASYEE